MNPQLKNPKFYLMIVSDVCLFAAALYLSYLIRFEFTLESFYAAQISTLLLWVIPLKLAVFLVGGLYNTPQKLDRAIRWVIVCHNREGERIWQNKCGRVTMRLLKPKLPWKQ
jgi:hypothetical protein